MTIVLRAEHEQLLQAAINSGLASSTDEALDQAFAMLRSSLRQTPAEKQATRSVARRLATFGKRNGLSLDGITVKDLLRESRP